MNINGITANPQRPSLGATRTEPDRMPHAHPNGIDRTTIATHNAHNADTPAATKVLKPQAPITHPDSTQSTVPADAPAGTDAMLWSVLTTEERSFFAKSAALGPLTYSRIKEASKATPPVARGVRLDVRA